MHENDMLEKALEYLKQNKLVSVNPYLETIACISLACVTWIILDRLWISYEV